MLVTIVTQEHNDILINNGREKCGLGCHHKNDICTDQSIEVGIVLKKVSISSMSKLQVFWLFIYKVAAS